MMGRVIDFDPTEIIKTPEKYRYRYGDTVMIGNKWYKYVYFHKGDGNVSGVKGRVAYKAFSGTTTLPTPDSVTMDYNTATAVKAFLNAIEGVFCSAPDTTGYGVWIQTWGPSDNDSYTDGSVDVGDGIFPAGADGQVIGIAYNGGITANLGPQLGIATSADGSGSAASVDWRISKG